MNIDFESTDDVLNIFYVDFGSYDFFQLVYHIRIFFIQVNKTKKIFPAASAASEKTKTFFQDHSCVKRGKVFGHTHDGNGSLRINMVNDLIDGFG